MHVRLPYPLAFFFQPPLNVVTTLLCSAHFALSHIHTYTEAAAAAEAAAAEDDDDDDNAASPAVPAADAAAASNSDSMSDNFTPVNTEGTWREEPEKQLLHRMI